MNLRIFIWTNLLLFSFLTNAQDGEPPKLNSFQFLTDTIIPGQKFYAKVNITDDISGLDTNNFSMYLSKKAYCNDCNYNQIRIDKIEKINGNDFTISGIGLAIQKGDYYANTRLCDNASNCYYPNGNINETIYLKSNIDCVNTGCGYNGNPTNIPDSLLPKIVSIKHVKTFANPLDTLSIIVEPNKKLISQNFNTGWIAAVLRSPSGYAQINSESNLFEIQSDSGKYLLTFAIPDLAEWGNWSIDYLMLGDTNSYHKYYNTDELLTISGYDVNKFVVGKTYTLSTSGTSFTTDSVTNTLLLDVKTDIPNCNIWVNDSWIIVDKYLIVGSNNLTTTSILISCDEDNFVGQRKGTIILNGKGLNKEIEIIQNASRIFSLQSKDLYLYSNASTNSIFSLSDKDVNITNTYNWINVVPKVGNNFSVDGIGYFNIIVSQNIDSLPRIAVLTATSGNLIRFLTITQAGISITNPNAFFYISLKDTTINNDSTFIVNYIAGSETIHIQNSFNWISINYLDSSNNVGFSQKLLSIKVESNNDSLTRIATLTVSSGNLIDFITITQIGSGQSIPINDYLIVSNNFYSLNNDRDTISVYVQSSQAFTFNNSYNWITINAQTTISGNNIIPVIIEQNPDSTLRQAIITVNSGNLSRTITIIQSSQYVSLPIDTISSPNPIIITITGSNTIPGVGQNPADTITSLPIPPNSNINLLALAKNSAYVTSIIGIKLDTVINGSKPVLYWQQVPSWKGYCIEISTDSVFSTTAILISVCGLRVNDYTIQNGVLKSGRQEATLSDGTKYYYRISGLLEDGSQSAWTKAGSFVYKSSETDINEAVINSNIVIFPNPSSGKFTIKGLNENSPIKILNVNGGIIYSGNTNDDIEITQKGLYFITISTSNGNKIFKLAIQ
ncbi:MAG: BACON domain-containing carbohydrate-binding protein [Bacteroidota bacterium]|nr:BACON domain-containing carbohydrate-binding protein [Bacteroidota bacterium]